MIFCFYFLIFLFFLGLAEAFEKIAKVQIAEIVYILTIGLLVFDYVFLKFIANGILKPLLNLSESLL